MNTEQSVRVERDLPLERFIHDDQEQIQLCLNCNKPKCTNCVEPHI